MIVRQTESDTIIPMAVSMAAAAISARHRSSTDALGPVGLFRLTAGSASDNWAKTKNILQTIWAHNGTQVVEYNRDEVTRETVARVGFDDKMGFEDMDLTDVQGPIVFDISTDLFLKRGSIRGIVNRNHEGWGPSELKTYPPGSVLFYTLPNGHMVYYIVTRTKWHEDPNLIAYRIGLDKVVRDCLRKGAHCFYTIRAYHDRENFPTSEIFRTLRAAIIDHPVSVVVASGYDIF